METMTLTKLLIIVLAVHNIAGAGCRFARTSASQGSCVFPCRCTKGCNEVTGECINDGQCKDGPPSGHRWNGTACQIGNVAYKRAIVQGIHFFGSVSAVDGSIKRCAYDKGGPGRGDLLTIDLGREYTMFRVTLYFDGHGFLGPTILILSVGNSLNTTTHSRCGIWHGELEHHEQVNVSCEKVTRYLSFRILHAHFPLELCELVVIGNRYIKCDQCPSTSACNDVVGCDECRPGKQQADCVKDCANGTYGINCVENCGHCKNNAPCEVTDGRCTSGCDTWYLTDTCNTYIPIPHFKASDKLDVEHITSSSAVVSWPPARHIPPGLESQYYYVVLLDADGKTETNAARLPHKAAGGRFQSHITGLEFNTQYSVRVKPYRRHNAEYQGGTTTGIAGFKTSCRDPSIPVVENVQTSACGSIFVKWKSLGDSGCDEIVEVRVSYKRQSSNTDDWSYKEAASVNETTLTIDYLTIEQYEVKVSVTNNKDFVSSSKVVVADFQKFKRSKSKGVTASGAGLAAGTFLLGVLVGGGALYVVYRMRRGKPTTGNKRQQNKDIAMDNRADILEDEEGYVNTAQRRDQHVYANAYDVIST